MGLTDWELWACAQQVIKQHRAKAPVHVTAMIEQMASAGDHEGVQAWRAIAERVDQLMDWRICTSQTRQFSGCR